MVMRSMSLNAFRRLTGTAALVFWLVSPAPSAATVADDLCSPGSDPCVVSTTVTVDDGSTIDVGARELRIVSGGILDAPAGMMTLQARVLTIQANGTVRALGGPAQRGGTIEATADSISIAGTLD